MKREEIITRVNSVLLEEFDLEEGDLHADAHFGDDLDLDSLDGIDLVVALEREFKESAIKIEEEHARELRYLRDVYDYIENFAKNMA